MLSFFNHYFFLICLKLIFFTNFILTSFLLIHYLLPRLQTSIFSILLLEFDFFVSIFQCNPGFSFAISSVIQYFDIRCRPILECQHKQIYLSALTNKISCAILNTIKWQGLGQSTNFASASLPKNRYLMYQ